MMRGLKHDPDITIDKTSQAMLSIHDCLGLFDIEKSQRISSLPGY